MSLGDISISLNLDGRDFELGIRRADRLMAQLGSQVGNTDRSIRRHRGTLRTWSRQLKDVIFTLGALPFAIEAVATSINATIGSIIRANAQMERLNQLMIGLSSGSTTMAEAQADANKQMDYMFGLADSTPFDIHTLTDGMVKFKSGGLDPTTGSFQALIDSVAKFGGTSQQLHRSSVAIQQMAGKGVISMEELRQQLGEAVPDAIRTMARGLGTTVSNLTKQVSKGVVEANTALEAMFNQMALQNAGSAYAMSRTWHGLVARMTTKWLKFRAMIGEQGAFEEIKESLEDFVLAMDNQSFQNFGAEMGKALASVIVGLKEATLFLVENIETVKVLAAGWLAYMIATSRAVRAANLGVGTLRASMIGLSATSSTFMARDAALRRSLNATRVAMAGSTNAASYLAYSQRNATVAARLHAHRLTVVRAAATSCAASMRALGASVYTALGPVGLLITALWALYEIVNYTSDETERYNRLVEGTVLAADKETLAIQRKTLALTKEKLARRDALHKADALYSNKDAQARPGAEAAYDRKTAKLVEDIAKMESNLTKGIKNVGKVAGEASITKFLDDASIRAKEFNLEMTSQLDQLDVIREKAGKDMDDKAYAKEANRITSSYKAKVLALYEPQLQIAKNQESSLVMQRKRLREQGKKLSDEQIIDLKGREIAVKRLQTEVDKYSKLHGTTQMKLMEGKGSNKSVTERMYDRTTASVAKLTAEANGANGALAKFNEEVKAGKYDDASDEQLAGIRKNLIAMHELGRVKKSNLKVSKDIISVEKTLLNQTGRINAELLKIASGSANPWLKQTSGMGSLINTIERGKVKLSEMSLGTAEYSQRLSKINDLAEAAFSSQRTLDSVKAVEKMKSETKSLNRSLLTEKQQILAVHAETTGWLDEWLIKGRAAGTVTENQTEAFKRYKEALDRDVVRKTEGSVQALLRDWSDLGESMNNVWKSSMESMGDSLVEFAKTGKLDFANFLTEIGGMILKAQFNKMLADAFSGVSAGGSGGLSGLLGTAFNGILGAFGGTSSSTASAAVATPANFNTPIFKVTPHATGGVMNEFGSVPLRAYAKGGIARSPQLALFGEASGAEAYVPLPDGRSIPVTMQGGQSPDVTINVINQSGQQVNAKSRGQKFDGKSMILDVVLEAASKPGSFRTSMKESLA